MRTCFIRLNNRTKKGTVPTTLIRPRGGRGASSVMGLFPHEELGLAEVGGGGAGGCCDGGDGSREARARAERVEGG
ncbi:hypothetical protein PIB30_085526 [Stylosanthes scabra]|uniref:Uncharacterized protein n=1 Tax=Stylosanthes scabra TaxID=79078 RepID=A0ABU6QSF1_9FABA|nr:hypothetical protein [Stylosanthes scabra]